MIDRIKTVFNDMQLEQKIFIALSIVIFITMTVISFDYGMTGDEQIQNKYGKQVLNFYETFGEDETTLKKDEPINLYGGLFDFLAAFTNKYISWFDEYDTRHLLNAIFGFFTILYTALLARELGGWRMGIIAMLFLALSPRFLGHAMNNPKDIPFALAYIFTIYYIIKLLKELPKPSKKVIALTIAGIAMAINIRVGGILLIAYLGLFYIFEMLSRKGIKGIIQKETFKEVLDHGRYIFIIIVLGYFAGLLFWPYGIVNPFVNPFIALKEMTNYSTEIKILFNGEHIMSTKVPWYYALHWIGITTPIYILIGFALCILMFLFLRKHYNALYLFMVLFAVVFPIAYTIYQGSSLYDGWRHSLFIYPTLIVITAAFWNYLFIVLKGKIQHAVIITVMAIAMFMPAKWLIASHPNQYTYFNEIVGGLKGAYGDYETDYYMNSVRESCEWLINSKEFKESNKKLVIATNCAHPVQYYFKDYENKAKIIYTRYYQRIDKDWDYAIYYSRFVDKSQLDNKSWPPYKTIFKADADGVPLSVVIKRENKNDFLGQQALNSNKFAEAVGYFQQAVQKDPNNESTQLGLAMAYLNTNQVAKSMSAVNTSIRLYPENAQAYYVLGMAYQRMNKINEALLSFNKSTKISPKFVMGYAMIASIYSQKGNFDNAIFYLKKAIEVQPNYVQGYQMLAKIYQQKGDQTTANQYLQAVKQLQGKK